MKLKIKISNEGHIHLIGDMPAKHGGTFHFEQWEGTALAMENSKTGETIKTFKGNTIQDFGHDFPELLGMEGSGAVHGNIEIDAAATGKIKGIRNY